MTAAVDVRVAGARDTEVVAEHDRHVRPDVLADLIAAGRILVAADGDRLLGWLRWGLFWDEVPFVNMLFVLEADRGRGIGTELMDVWEVAMLAAGHDLVLTSTRVDEQAQHFYRKHGWTDCGSLLLPGEPTEIFLRKQLGARPEHHATSADV